MTAPMSRRDVWLSIALAVAKGELPDPESLSLHDQIVSVSLDTPAQVAQWGVWLGCGRADNEHWMPKVERWHHGWHTGRSEHPSGWAWQIRADVTEAPSDRSLAEQVVAAIGATS